MSGAFDGIRVVEIASGVAGPYAAMLLAEQGADVIKLEPVGGERARMAQPGFHVWNRSKRSAIADLRTGAGRAMARALVGGADVAIVDLTEDAAHEAGIDAAAVLAGAPRLVYCAMPPFGSRGPMANVTTTEALLDAYSGVHGGQSGPAPGGGAAPTFVLQPFGAYGAAFLAAQAVAAALFEREGSGRGQRVEVSWLAGAFAMQTASVVWTPQVQYLFSGARDPQGGLPTYRLYEAADGRWLFIACGNAVFYQRLLMAMGLETLLADERMVNGPWAIINPEARAELTARIAALIAGKPRAEWLAAFEAADVPCAPVGTRREFIEDAQVAANGMRIAVDDPVAGPMVQMGTPVTLGSTPGFRFAAPALGEDQGDVEALATEPAGERVAPGGPATRRGTGPGPLAGVRVVDFSSYIAGPLCPMMLADLGADVIKVESPDGDAFRSLGMGFQGWNRGKRSIALDLRKDEGRDVARRLVAGADVVVENLRSAALWKLGLDEPAVRAIRPDVIYCSVRGHGPGGPRADSPAFDPLLQARSGAMAAQGGDGPPVFYTVALSDYTAALLAAFGVCAALHERARTGEGTRVETSLTNAAIAAQSGSFVFYEGRPPEPAGGVGVLGVSLALRLWRAADDGWLLVDAEDAEAWGAFARLVGADIEHEEALAARPDDARAAGIERAFAEANRDVWLKQLSRAGVGAMPVLTTPDLLASEQVAANELLWESPHAQWGTIRQTGVLAKFDRTPGVAQRPAPLLGEHTDAVLAELGYDAGAIAALRGSGVVG